MPSSCIQRRMATRIKGNSQLLWSHSTINSSSRCINIRFNSLYPRIKVKYKLIRSNSIIRAINHLTRTTSNRNKINIIHLVTIK